MRRSLALLAAVAAAGGAAGCGDDSQPWRGDAGRIDEDAVSVAPSARSVPDEPARPSTPADAPSPAGTNPDGSTFGSTTPEQVTDGVRQDSSAMLTLRTAMSIIEGCHSGRPSYSDCDEQSDLGEPDRIGVTFGDGNGVLEVRVSASPRSLRLTTRSESGARFTVARSPGGDRFSCEAGSEPGACNDEGTWSW